MEAAQGSIFVKYINPPAASNPNTANFINEFSQLNPSVGGADPGVWASWAFDSVYALAYALRNATANNLNPKDPNLLMKLLYNTSFTGASGLVSFPMQAPLQDDRRGATNATMVSILNYAVAQGSMNVIGSATFGGNISFASNLIVWPGSTSSGPPPVACPGGTALSARSASASALLSFG